MKWRDIRGVLHEVARHALVRLLVGLLGLAGLTEVLAPEPVVQPLRDAAAHALAAKP